MGKKSRVRRKARRATIRKLRRVVRRPPLRVIEAEVVKELRPLEKKAVEEIRFLEKAAVKEEKVIGRAAVKEERAIGRAVVKEEQAVAKEVRFVEHELLLAERKFQKFGILEALQVLAGATIFTSIIALEGQVWPFAITSSWNLVAALNVFAFVFALAIMYLSGYLRIKRHHTIIARAMTVRMLMMYATALASAALILTIIRGGEWLSAYDLALKQIFVLVLPALVGGALADLIAAEV